MGRWIAIGTAPGWSDIDTFKAELAATDKWRIDAQTSITTVMALADGRVLAECHAPKRDTFDAWLKQKGWSVESVTPVKHVAKTGNVWKLD